MLTEEEAKTKWCPMARFSPDAAGYASGNRFSGWSPAEDNCHCIASGCMAWRWDAPTGKRKREMPGRISTQDRGYCGAFGKPELPDQPPEPGLEDFAPGATGGWTVRVVEEGSP